jgi:NADH dehydrogenase
VKKIVVLGGGYGGQSVLLQLLEKKLPMDVEIILIDRMPYQGLKTEYYALAAGTVADVNLRVSFPTHPQLRYHYGEVSHLDCENQRVYMVDGDPINYTTLIIALGCTDRYHGIPGADLYTHSLQSFQGARKTMMAVQDLKPYGQVTIVGGGLSGVEIAAELRESRSDLKIRIIDRGPSILSPFPEKLKAAVRAWFIEHDVELRPNTSLSRVESGVLYDLDEPITSDVIIWTAGIQPVEVVQKLELAKDAMGRVLVNDYYQVPEHPEVYIIGDCASSTFSPSGQLAKVQGKQVAEVLQALWRGETPKLGPIKLKGTLGSLGKKTGFGVVGNNTMFGSMPRVLKSGVLWMSKNQRG